MGQVLIRNLDDSVVENLKRLAAERGTSLEQIARDALTDLSRTGGRAAALARMDAIRDMTAPDPGSSSADEIRAEREWLAGRHDHGSAALPSRPRRMAR